MEDLVFRLEIDGEYKVCEIVFSYYNEYKDKYYIIFEIEGQEELESAVLISKGDNETILEDIETDEEFDALVEEYDKYLDNTEKLTNEEQ